MNGLAVAAETLQIKDGDAVRSNEKFIEEIMSMYEDTAFSTSWMVDNRGERHTMSFENIVGVCSYRTKCGDDVLNFACELLCRYICGCFLVAILLLSCN